MNEAVAVDCPAHCRYRHLEHLHVEFADGYGEVVSPTGGIIEPFDLGRPARLVYQPGTLPVRAADLPGFSVPGCVRHSWGTVHVKPSCRCPKPGR